MAAKQINIIRADIAKLGEAEKNVKQLLGTLASDVLVFLHEHGQAGVMNETLRVLSPVNRKVAQAFFSQFSGFSYSKEDEGFTKKIKPQHDKEGNVTKDVYTDAKLAFQQFIDEGGNFWTWWKDSQKHEKQEGKPLDLAKLTATVKKAAERAQKEGISRTALFNAVVSDVFSPEDILDMLAGAAQVNKVVTAAKVEPKAEVNPAAEAVAA